MFNFPNFAEAPSPNYILKMKMCLIDSYKCYTVKYTLYGLSLLLRFKITISHINNYSL